jgi:hypothetical protein
MRRPTSLRAWPRAPLAAAVVAFVAADCSAIEMFTFFGDGSRIGLPSLEVPVEAYPGIPLRSDRLRARRRAMRMGPGSAVTVGPPGYARGVTIRAMPDPAAAGRMPAGRRPRVLEVEPPLAESSSAIDDPAPVAPEPEAITPPSLRP